MATTELPVMCTCEAKIVAATPREIWDGTPISCGAPGCTGRPGRPANDRTKRRLAPVAACGTLSGYQKHLRHAERPCAACITEKSRYNADYAAKRRAAS